MPRVTPLVLLLCLSLHAAAEPRVLRVPADYPTLAAAVEAAAPGDTVSLAAGKYPQTAQLLISKPLRIQGETADTTIIQTTCVKEDTVRVDKVDGFSIDNMTFEYTGPPPPEQNNDFHSQLNIIGGRAEVSNCAFLKSAGFGFVLQHGVAGSVRGCRTEDSFSAGLWVRGAGTSVSVRDSDLGKSNYSGILVSEDASANLEENRCSENAEDGITAVRCRGGKLIVRGNSCDRNGSTGVHASACSTVCIENNSCQKNGESGVQVDTGSTGTITGNICVGGRHGVAVRSAGTVATAEKNTCSESFEAAIAVYFGAKATVAGNNCNKNAGTGIRVTHWETSADVLDNTCSSNVKCGILVDMGGHAAVRGNECNGNGYYGILVSDAESAADIGENRAKDNVKGDRDVHTGLPAKNEYQVRNYEIGSALMNGQFAYLERIVARLRKYQSRYNDGGWQLYSFYEGLKYGCELFNLNTKPDFCTALEKWAADFPDSSTPRLALAMTERAYAWECRGTKWASEVTPAGWKGFQEHGDAAEKWCVDAESKADKDAHLYALRISMVKDRGGSKASLRALLDTGMSIDPECLGLYTATCQSLWPRWGGSEEEIKQFFSTVHDLTKEKMGEKMYALLIDSQFDYGAVYGDLGDWKLCKAGFDQLLEEFPQSWFFLNRYCLLACVFDDKEKARELLGKIGDQPDQSAWVHNKENFANAKRWALSDGPRPDFYRVPGRPPGNLDAHRHRSGSGAGPKLIPALAAVAGITRKQIAIGLLVAGVGVCLLTILIIFLIVRLTRKRE